MYQEASLFIIHSEHRSAATAFSFSSLKLALNYVLYKTRLVPDRAKHRSSHECFQNCLGAFCFLPPSLACLQTPAQSMDVNGYPWITMLLSQNPAMRIAGKPPALALGLANGQAPCSQITGHCLSQTQHLTLCHTSVQSYQA